MKSTLLDVDLTGAFASDGTVGEEVQALPPVPLPVVLADDLFASPVAAITPGSGTMAGPVTVNLDSSSIAEEQGTLPGIGDILDKYRIDAELGRGGFAVVYRATHLLMQTTVALKVLYPWMLSRHPDLAEQLCEEAKFTSLVDHQNVVRVQDVTSSREATFIVMEFIDGPSLARVIARKPMTCANVIKIGIHIANGLKAAQTQGLIHRDIKPGNILLARTGHPKIVDFGLARRHGKDVTESDRRIAGTPAYLAPEQARDPVGTDFRADIYALGATLYHAAVGRPPFLGSDPIALINDHLHQVPPHPAMEVEDFDPGLAELLLMMLEKDPARRPSSYDDLITRLMGLHRRSTSPIPSHEASSSKTFMRRMRGLFRE